MEIIIRKASHNDVAVLALLGQISFREAFGHFWTDKAVLQDYFKNTFSVAKMRSSLSKENNVFWLAFANELPVGYAKLKKHSPYEKLKDPSPAQLQKIYLLNDYIGQNIGQQLQDVLFDEVRAQGIKTLWLAVWDQNTKAVRFYERHGFSKTARYHYSFKSLEADYEVMTKPF